MDEGGGSVRTREPAIEAWAPAAGAAPSLAWRRLGLPAGGSPAGMIRP